MRHDDDKKKELLQKATNFGLLEITYNHIYVLPYDDAIKVMAMFKNAEWFNDERFSSDTCKTVRPVNRDDSVKLTMLNQEDYLTYKAAHLLGVNDKNE